MLTEKNQPTNTAVPVPNLIPIIRELPADLETPVSVYLKLAGSGPSFLLESITGGEQVARYSFIGVQPSKAYVLQENEWQVCKFASAHPCTPAPLHPCPLSFLRAELNQYHLAPTHGLPRFAGGLVGYLGYEMMRYFEPTVPLAAHPNLPDAILLFADTLVAFDHAFGKLLLIANAHINGNEQAARAAAEARLDALEAQLQAPIPPQSRPAAAPADTTLRSNMTQEAFETAVLRAKSHIAAGDTFQIVPSQRFSRETGAAPFDIYRALRRLNPSPYMFFFDFDGLAGDEPFYLIGASPEMHVRLEDGIASVRPIAGTRPRGKTPGQDQTHEADLLADPKERAEHVMLVDLGRNDLGRVCEYGSVHVPELMVIERYSHVMHIVSHVQGKLRREFDAFDLLRHTFPAGTVTGAPKIRAMQIINDLEPGPRGPYAGAVGYVSFDGSMDTCIAIRTLTMHGRTISIQAGAGIVADSDPASEYQETVNKAKALAVAVEMAEK
ncbi:MAG: anthranilate synthase component I [Ardenticatenaceae bacterium]|nr:anthranilate synthase component I [Ardenticatenaceae bacterium]MCB9003367.1 anthranilate synthase component I [Ardenticatenaceae bacterium]